MRGRSEGQWLEWRELISVQGEDKMYFLILGSKRVNPLSLKFLDYTFIYGLALDGEMRARVILRTTRHSLCVSDRIVT